MPQSIQEEVQGRYDHEKDSDIRDANSMAIFILWGSGNLEPIPWGAWGIFGDLDPLK